MTVEGVLLFLKHGQPGSQVVKNLPCLCSRLWRRSGVFYFYDEESTSEKKKYISVDLYSL